MDETQRQVSELAGEMDQLQWNQWARAQLIAMDCGDARRNERLVSLLGAIARRPGQSLPQQCEQDAPLKAAYRLLDCETVQPALIMQSAAIATIESIQSRQLQGVLLAVQDTTTLNFTTHTALKERGPIGNNDKTQEFHAHTTLLLGEPLGPELVAEGEALVHGLLECEVYARDATVQRARKPGERNR